MKTIITQKSYTHITGRERHTIDTLLYMNTPIRGIARILGRSPSTISEEVQRNGGVRVYDCDRADAKSRARWNHTHKKQRLEDEYLRKYVEHNLAQGYSPQQIVGLLHTEHPTYSLNHETIYRYVYRNAPHLTIYLRKKHKKRKKRSSRCTASTYGIPNRVSIHERGDISGVYGHIEVDEVGASSSSTIAIFRDISLRYVFLRKVYDHTAASLHARMCEVLDTLPATLRKTCTYDNGKENVLHQNINELYGMQSYFCDSYSAWQKGGVENEIGLLREYFPKGTNFNNVSESAIMEVETCLNNRPRKCLNFRTPAKVFAEALQSVRLNC